jgi:hypothetical protein
MRGMAGWVLVAACAGEPEAPRPTPPLQVATFNTGTTSGSGELGFGAEEAELADAWYGNGLAFHAAMSAAEDWVAVAAPDLLGLQEIFDTAECAAVPEEARGGFVCATLPAARWSDPDAHVAVQITGPDWQVACHPDRTDKCLAVRREVATFPGCEGERCDAALTGAVVEGCGSGARVAAVTLDLADGATLRVVHVHGSSGLSPDDIACRTRQVEAALDLIPAEGDVIVLGDLNTDPGRFSGDASAAAWRDGAVARGLTFHTDATGTAPPTYQGAATIDHVLSRGFDGRCLAASIDADAPALQGASVFDHRPVLCALGAR